MPPKKQCKHPNPVPLEIAFASIKYPNGYKERAHYDYAVVASQANVARVRKYYCPVCDQEIKAPMRGD